MTAVLPRGRLDLGERQHDDAVAAVVPRDVAADPPARGARCGLRRLAAPRTALAAVALRRELDERRVDEHGGLGTGGVAVRGDRRPDQVDARDAGCRAPQRRRDAGHHRAAARRCSREHPCPPSVRLDRSKRDPLRSRRSRRVSSTEASPFSRTRTRTAAEIRTSADGEAAPAPQVCASPPSSTTASRHADHTAPASASVSPPTSRRTGKTQRLDENALIHTR